MPGLRRLRALSAQLRQHATAAAPAPETGGGAPVAQPPGPLTPQQLEHYRAFGFVTLPRCLMPELPALEREHEAALARAYGDAADPEARQTVRALSPSHSLSLLSLSLCPPLCLCFIHNPRSR